MAQRTRSLQARARLLARRYGLVGRTVFLVACLGVVLLLAGAGYMAARTGTAEELVVERGEEVEAPEPEEQAEAVEDEESAPILVHVDGAVVSPGVYELEGAEPRVNDVVVRAGGLTPEADTSSVNLAAPVSDGQKVHIPLVGEVPVAAPSVGAETSPATAVAQAVTGLVNLNTASRDELMTLSGIGEVTADAIIEDREAHGPYSAPEDLMRVSGIGEKKFAKIRDAVCV